MQTGNEAQIESCVFYRNITVTKLITYKKYLFFLLQIQITLTVSSYFKGHFIGMDLILIHIGHLHLNKFC